MPPGRGIVDSMTKRRGPFRILLELAAGVHTANGLAHGVPPDRASSARNPRPSRDRGFLGLSGYASSEAGGLKRSP